MRKNSTSRWHPRTIEDRLIQTYWSREGGTLILEVPIGGAGGRGAWTKECGVRRIDGVLFRHKHRQAAVHRFSREIWEPLQSTARSVELIEVKPSLNRSAIGQAIV